MELKNFMVKSGLDLSLARSIRGISNPNARNANELGQTCFCASNVALAADHFPPLCRPIQRGTQGQTFLLSRPVYVHGVCATDLPRESSRHPSLSAQPVRQALPYGLSQHGIAQHVGQCECSSRLAHLCRLRTEPDRYCTPALCGRTVWRRSLGNGLRAGCNHHRSVPVGISVGAVSFDQGGDQAAYAARPAWQHPQFHPYQRWQVARCEHSRPDHSRGWGVLHHGSRLSRFSHAASLASSRQLLCDARQVELFFKWIKQHLRIKSFFGTSENAVKSQIWIAVSVYVLVAILRKRLNITASLYEMLQILSLTMFERMALNQLFARTPQDTNSPDSANQLFLFD